MVRDRAIHDRLSSSELNAMQIGMARVLRDWRLSQARQSCNERMRALYVRCARIHHWRLVRALRTRSAVSPAGGYVVTDVNFDLWRFTMERRERDADDSSQIELVTNRTSAYLKAHLEIESEDCP